ncbi:MAG TPA: sugar phosphate nucleotidyltransferase [Sedimentisphaerales bacterium]|nr:sugar phosphate nucleotidyltransferase [Sedimentisphaerales bacterium]
MDYAVIMAGGSGKRLWPLSRRKRPKQVLKIFDDKTLLELCYERLLSVFKPAQILVLTNVAYTGLVAENLPQLPADNIIGEPAVRDTAGAIGLAAAVLTSLDSDATMAVVTADHLLEPAQVLQQALKDALVFANKNAQSIITFGIEPAFADTNLGYIKCVQPQQYPCCENKIYSVTAFKEKPDERTAGRYIKTGEYFWNCGMFVFKAAAILENLAKFLPESTEPLAAIKAQWQGAQRLAALQQWFIKMPKMSIDYAVMEKARDVYAIRLDCRWLDVGSFSALAGILPSDAENNKFAAGKVQLLDCKDSIFVTEDRGHLIAAVGLENVIVVHSPDATLVCPVEQAGRLKELLDMLEGGTGEKFL